MATINGKTLGTVKTESQTKESNLFFTALPYSDSDEAILIDLMGTTRTISVSGAFVSTSKVTLQGYVNNIEAIQNGEQSAVAYVGDFIQSPSKNVEIQTFTWNWTEADPNRITYDLTLLEGSS